MSPLLQSSDERSSDSDETSASQHDIHDVHDFDTMSAVTDFSATDNLIFEEVHSEAECDEARTANVEPMDQERVTGYNIVFDNIRFSHDTYEVTDRHNLYTMCM